MSLVEKYRPKTLDEIYSNEANKTRLRSLLNQGLPQNMIFVGPPGSGKNSTAYALAREYFDSDNIGLTSEYEDYLELNASDERGIDTIRITVKGFTGSRGRDDKKRIIFVDEAGGLTNPAQGSLKVIMEKNANLCCFILSMNTLTSAFNSAIISRCIVFEFNKAPIDDMVGYFKKIADAEGIIFEDETLIKEIAEKYDGDFRAMVNNSLQCLVGIDHPITRDDIKWIFDEEFDDFVKALATSSNKKSTYIQYYKTHGINYSQLLESLYKEIGYKYSKTFAKVDARLKFGGNPFIQFIYLLEVLENG